MAAGAKRAASRRRPVAIIGWNELVDLPVWGIHRLRAKIDTGARSSALHVENIEELPRDRVRFSVVIDRGKGSRSTRITAHVVRRSKVRSSTGHLRTRIFVTTTVKIGPLERSVEVGLVDREKMIYRMLVGRTALGGRFLVDTGAHCLHGKPLRRRSSREDGP